MSTLVPLEFEPVKQKSSRLLSGAKQNGKGWASQGPVHSGLVGLAGDLQRVARGFPVHLRPAPGMAGECEPVRIQNVGLLGNLLTLALVSRPLRPELCSC